MRINRRNVFAAIISLLLVMHTVLLPVSAVGGCIDWYCVRNKDHRQPTLGSDLAVIERYGGIHADRSHGDTCDDKVVYLTFDAGYENGNIARILDTLKQEDVKGAFFVLGNLVRRNTDLVLRMIDEGHLVCNHTYSHKRMVGLSFEEFSLELEKLENAFFECTGKKLAKYYRPPEGKFDEESMSYAEKLGYKTVFWSIAYADWDNSHQMSEDLAMSKILDNIHNGAVILLHPTSSTNANIMARLIRELRSMGYRFGCLDEIKTAS